MLRAGGRARHALTRVRSPTCLPSHQDDAVWLGTNRRGEGGPAGGGLAPANRGAGGKGGGLPLRPSGTPAGPGGASVLGRTRVIRCPMGQEEDPLSSADPGRPSPFEV